MNLLTPEQVAKRLGIKVDTLKNWRTKKRNGPPYVKVGGVVRYRPADIEAFITARIQEG